MRIIKKNKQIAMRGRPTTEKGIEKVTQNLKPQVKHGYYYFKNNPNRMAITCDLCPFKSNCEYANTQEECVPVVHYQEEIIEDIAGLPHIKPQDMYLVHRFAHVQARLMMLDKWLGEIAGNFRVKDDAVDVQPITRARKEDERTLMRLADKLCLSPDSRARVGFNMAQTYSLAQALSEVDYEKNTENNN